MSTARHRLRLIMRILGGACIWATLIGIDAMASEAPKALGLNPGDSVVLELTGNRLLTGTVLEVTEASVRLSSSREIHELDRELIQRVRVATPAPKPPKGPPAIPGKRAEEEEDPSLDVGIGARVERPKPPEGKEADLVKSLLKVPPAEVRTPVREALPGKRLPNDPDASKGLATVLPWIEKRWYDNAAIVLRKLVSSPDRQELSRAEEESLSQLKVPLKELMVTCYVESRCERCKAEGVLKCKFCNGNGYTIHWITNPRGEDSAVNPGTRERKRGPIGFQDPDNEKTFRRIRLCDACRGQGYELCPLCWGTRLKFYEATPYEREAYADRLLGLGENCLGSDESSYGDTKREPPPGEHPKLLAEQVWLRDSMNHVKSDLLRLYRAQTYFVSALYADPRLVFRTKKDYFQEITKLGHRIRHLWGELHERMLVYARNRTLDRLEEVKVSGSKAGQIIGDE